MRRPSSSTNITSKHGSPTGGFYGKHLGTDYALSLNNPIVAPVNGKIAAQGWSNTVGNYIEIDGDDGRRHRLLHLNQRLVPNGRYITEGQQVGLSGSTGSSSTGPHIHWDARKGGTGFGDGFANYVDTEALVVAQPPAPVPTGDTRIGRMLYLHPVPQWSVYRVGQQPIRSQRIGYLIPQNYYHGPGGKPGLTYRIEAVSKYPNTVTIRTDTYGLVDIFVDSDGEII